MNVFSRREVLTHNKKNDCWIIVRNSVYDITKLLSLHPGGIDILMARAGEDASSYFITKHLNNKAVWQMLNSYKIGEIAAEEQIEKDDLDEPFLIELIEQCIKKKLYTPPIWYKNTYFYIRFVGLIFFWGLSFGALYANAAWYVAVPLVFLQAILGVSLFGFIAHEATHRNYPKNSILRAILKITWPIYWPFISQTPLQYEHNSHHLKIGDPEYDYEVAGFASVIRYSGLVEHKREHKTQHRTARLLYPLYANIITTIGGIKSGFWERHNRKVGLEHTISIIATLTYYILIPTMLGGNILFLTLLYIIYQCTLFYGIYITSAINHFIPAACEPIPHTHSNKYAYYVCHNTSNFCVTSYFWFWFSGGFNIQLEHHLIPFIPVENLRKMIPITEELCKKYGYPYNKYVKFSDLWKDHYSYLLRLSIKEQESSEVENKMSYQAR